MKKCYDIYFDTIKKGDKHYNIMTTEIDKKSRKIILYAEVEIKKDISEDENYCYLVDEIIKQAESNDIDTNSLLFYDMYRDKLD